jgi:hypothetical protein
MFDRRRAGGEGLPGRAAPGVAGPLSEFSF